MALDVHIAITLKAAERQKPALSIEEEQHEQLFTVHKSAILKCKALGRLHDYYADAQFGGNEVRELQHDLLSIDSAGANEPLRELLLALQNVCAVAIERGQNLYFFCD